jgi:hypothetical protein
LPAKTGKDAVDTSDGQRGGIAGVSDVGTAMLKQQFPRFVRASAGNAMYNHYCCKDDKWLAIAHLDPDRWWPKVCGALGLERLINDPRFNSLHARAANGSELVAIFDQVFAGKTRDEWMQILDEHGCIYLSKTSKGRGRSESWRIAHDEIEHPVYGPTKPWISVGSTKHPHHGGKGRRSWVSTPKKFFLKWGMAKRNSRNSARMGSFSTHRDRVLPGFCLLFYESRT